MKNFRFLILLLFLIPTSLFAQIQSINVDGAKIFYHQAGKGNRVLFLVHGFMANGAQWDNFTAALENQPDFRRQYTVVAPDIPGFGSSTGYPFSAYRPVAKSGLSETKLLYDFLVKLHLEHHPVDIAGNSLGGMLAAMLTEKYAAHYPDQLNVKSLTFIGSPAGIEPLSETIFNALESGYNPFIPTNTYEFTQEIKWLIYNSAPVLGKITPQEIREITTNNQQRYKQYSVVSAFLGMPPYLTYISSDKDLKKLTQPVAIFWGKNDNIFAEKTGLPLLKKSFAHVQEAEAVPQAGHVITLESSVVVNHVAKAYYHFLLRYSNSSNG